MNRETIVQSVGRPILKPIGLMQLICLSAFLSTPFIWIWAGWGLAWKISLTGFIGTLILYWVYNVVKSMIEEQVDETIKNKPSKSKFQERLDNAIKEASN